MTDRALATVETVTEVTPIEGADAIELAHVRGWQVVVKKDTVEAGNRVVIFEIDSMLDVTDDRFAFLAPRGVREDAEGHRGHVLKTIRLRGQVSQGLVLPLTDFPELQDHDGDDVTDTLGIRKWEPRLPAELAGAAKGTLPSWISKTDEDRLQNMRWVLEQPDMDWLATEKIDGSSFTFFVDGDTDGVCSRNYSLLEAEGNTAWKLGRDSDIFGWLRSLGWDRTAVQGELFGEGIQANPLKVRGQQYRIFNMIRDGEQVPRRLWPVEALEMSVPVLDLEFPHTLEEALDQADALTTHVQGGSGRAEGIVWRSRTSTHIGLLSQRRASFKVISNRYLLKHDQ